MPTQAEVDAVLNANFIRTKQEIDALWGNAPITSNLQAAINNAKSGDTITLASGFFDANPIVVNKPVRILGTGPAQITGGMDIPAPSVILDSITEISKAAQRNDIITVSGGNCSIFNTNIKGNPVLGQKRGIAANAVNLVLKNVKITDIFLTDQDSQAVAGWDNMLNFLAEDCYFSAAGETFLVGGADPANITRQPNNVTLRRCILTKDIKWKTPSIQVKNTLELKNVIGFLADQCVIENSWQQAQDGYLIVLTPRNQDGTAPYSSIQNVTIQNCKGGHAAVLLNMSGTDDEKPSGRLDGVKFINNQFDDINPATWMTSGNWWDHSDQSIKVGNGPSSIIIDKNVITGMHLGSNLYFYGTPKCNNFIFTNNKYPKSTYGTPSAASPWADFVASGTFSGNTEV